MNAAPDSLPDARRSRVDPEQVRALLASVVGDAARVAALDPGDALFDHLPELDSIACVNLMLAIESRYGIEIDDDDVDESLFDSLDALRAYIDERLAEGGG